MTPYETYLDYVSLKLHYTDWRFSYTRFGRLKIRPETLERRSDRYKFESLSKRPLPSWTMASVFARNENSWVGDMLGEDAEVIRDESLGRCQSITRTLERELPMLEPDCIDLVKGRHPTLARMAMGNRISLETASLVLYLSGRSSEWRESFDPAMESITRRLVKYYPLIPVDKNRVKKIVYNHFGW